jgi:hypothetical protein
MTASVQCWQHPNNKTISLFRQEHNNSVGLMFIIIATNALVISIKLKLIRRVSVFLHHLQGAYKLCRLKL